MANTRFLSVLILARLMLPVSQNINLERIGDVFWKDDEETVYFEVSSSEIMKFDLSRNKISPVYKNKDGAKILFFSISGPGNMLGLVEISENLSKSRKREFFLRIIDISKNTEICRMNLKEILKDVSEKHGISTSDWQLEWSWYIPYLVNNDSIVLLIHEPTGNHTDYNEFFVEFDYRSQQIKKSAIIPEYLKYDRPFHHQDLSDVSRKFILRYKVFCYDIGKGEIIYALPDEFIRNLAKTEPHLPVRISDNTTFFDWEGLLYSFNLETKKLAQLPIPRKISENIVFFIPTEKYLCLEIKGIGGRLYVRDKGKIIESPVLNNIREKNLRIVSFSPSGEKVLAQDENSGELKVFFLP